MKYTIGEFKNRVYGVSAEGLMGVWVNPKTYRGLWCPNVLCIIENGIKP